MHSAERFGKPKPKITSSPQTCQVLLRDKSSGCLVGTNLPDLAGRGFITEQTYNCITHPAA
jgi:hypothetical protein